MMNQPVNALAIRDCWNQIGITGDKTCPQLEQVIHCRNCPVYSSEGRALFEREAPPGYLEEWTDLLSISLEEKKIKGTHSSIAKGNFDQGENSTISVIIFRLEAEWFALPIEVIQEVTPVFTVHSLPHRSNHVLRGIINIRGEIFTCVSLASVLGLKTYDFTQKITFKHTVNNVIYQRMIIMEIQENRWVFEVDELDSVHRFYSKDFHDSPTALSKTPDTYTKKIVMWNGHNVNYLDYELLFYELLFYTYSRSQ